MSSVTRILQSRNIVHGLVSLKGISSAIMSDPLSLGSDDETDVLAVGEAGAVQGRVSSPTSDEFDDLEKELQAEMNSSSTDLDENEVSEEFKQATEEDGDKANVSRQGSNISDYAEILAKIEEEMGSEPKDLDIVVDNPEKVVKAMESYIAFSVRTKTTCSDFENPEYSVKRRYNDFLWLRQQLEEKNPALIIPPLPEKHNLTIDRFDKEFIKFRQVSLHRFMGRLANHPIVSADRILRSFLTLETEEFQAFKKKGSGLLSRVTRSLSAMGGSYMLKNRGEEYTSLLEYAQKFGDKIGAFERISTRLVAEQNDYLSALSGYAPAFESWAGVETDLAANLQIMSKLMKSMHDDSKEMVDEMTLKTILPAKEYVLFAESMKAALVRRDALQHELELINEELVKSSEDKQQMENAVPGAGGFLSRSSTEESLKGKLEKLSGRVDELEAARNSCKTRLEERNLELKTDLERWHINKKADMKELIGGMADRNIEVYDKQIAALEGTLADLKKTITG
ncbi:sorting nexin-30-like [Watersipora subatra]|uniref:sorting nexin-30-like n=1 Tax=Watersipora subatra TaxID=2589382 RepID=UPI00355B1B29